MQTEVVDKSFSEVQSALVYKKKNSEDTKHQNKKTSNQVPSEFLSSNYFIGSLITNLVLKLFP